MWHANFKCCPITNLTKLIFCFNSDYIFSAFIPFIFVGNNPSEKINISKFKDVKGENIYPDFKHNSKKIAIETQYKSQKGGKLSKRKRFNNYKEWEDNRIKAYKLNRWKVFFVYADEFKIDPKKLLSKLKEFI